MATRRWFWAGSEAEAEAEAEKPQSHHNTTQHTTTQRGHQKKIET